MNGKLVEFPRRLEWTAATCWVGRVKGSNIVARVEQVLDGPEFQWFAWHNGVVLGGGLATSLEEGQSLAKEAIEKQIVVVRVLPQEKA